MLFYITLYFLNIFLYKNIYDCSRNNLTAYFELFETEKLTLNDEIENSGERCRGMHKDGETEFSIFCNGLALSTHNSILTYAQKHVKKYKIL